MLKFTPQRLQYTLVCRCVHVCVKVPDDRDVRSTGKTNLTITLRL